MSLDISFKVSFLIGEEIVPLASEIAIGAVSSSNGVSNGFGWSSVLTCSRTILRCRLRLVR